MFGSRPTVGPPVRPWVFQMPYQREAEVVLAAWRESERRLADAAPGSAEEEEIVADLARMRDEYQRLIQLARAVHRPEPPPFPVDEGDLRS
jgi:hypothetical protein